MEGVPNNGDPSVDPPVRPRPSPTPYDPIYRPRPFPSRKRSIQNPPLALPIETETYVIQIPKDQIFSVPPPENAAIVERYRNPVNKENTYCKRLLCIVITLIVLVLTIGIISAMFHLLFSPQVPVFSIVHVSVTNPHSSGHKKAHFGYEIALKTNNPNGRMSISYGSGGDAILLYKDHKIGTSKFPDLNQDADSSNNVRLDLTGTKGALPHDVEVSVQDKRRKKHTSLWLKMNVPIKMKVGALELWSKVINVVCNFKVSSLGADKNILSQKCQAQFK